MSEIREPEVSLHNPLWGALIAIGLLTLLLVGLTQQSMAAQALRAPAQAAIEVQQTVGETVGICAPTTVIAVTTGRSVYYCVTLRNNGTVPLSHHTLRSSFSPLTTTFMLPINPGQEIKVTSNVLGSLGASGAVLSQLVNTNITNTITVTSTNADAVIATGQAIARVVLGSVGVKVTKTVNLNDSCAATKGIAVAANTTVKYCVTLQNTGTLPLTNHRLSDPLLDVDVSFPLPVPPGATLVITDGALRAYDSNQQLESVITNNITNTVTLTSATVEGVTVSGHAQAVAVIGRTSTVLSYTIGLEDRCGTSTSLSVVSGRTIYHCLKLINNGTVPLDAHTIQWVQPSSTTPLVNTTITETVQPGQSLVITRSRLAPLGQANVVATATNNFAVISRSHQGMVTTAQAQTQVTVGTQGLTVSKYATTDRNGCVAAVPLSITAAQEFYYCVVITNTGQVPLVRHTLSEGAPVNLSGTFTYTLAPSQRITLTNQTIGALGLPSTLLGPFRTSANFGGTLTVSSFSAANIQVSQSATVQVNVTVPTPTPTTPPTPIPTWTPTISPTPTPSPTLPPTPTPTPVVLSFQPTPTQPFGIDSVATPTPGFLSGAAPQALDAFGQPISPLGFEPTPDVASTLWALTVEAAATQTAFAFTPPIIDTPIPPLVETPFVEAPFVESPLETPMLPVTEVMPPTATQVVLMMTPLPTPEVVNDYVSVVAQVFQVSTATLGWIWFLVGSVVFFATAGMFAGVSWRQRGRQQGVYEMDEEAAPMEDTHLVEHNPNFNQPGAQSPAAVDDDDYWPPSLR